MMALAISCHNPSRHFSFTLFSRFSQKPAVVVTWVAAEGAVSVTGPARGTSGTDTTAAALVAITEAVPKTPDFINPMPYPTACVRSPAPQVAAMPVPAFITTLPAPPPELPPDELPVELVSPLDVVAPRSSSAKAKGAEKGAVAKFSVNTTPKITKNFFVITLHQKVGASVHFSQTKCFVF